MPADPGKEQQELRRVLREAVKASRVPRRELERALGLGTGRLDALLSGRLELRVRHLVALARVLKVPPGDFLELGFPEETRLAPNRLADWVGPVQPPHKSRARASAAAKPLPADLNAAIRAAVRQELHSRSGNGSEPSGT